MVVAYRIGWPDQEIIRGHLSDIRNKVRARKITRTALILIGPALTEEHRMDSVLYNPEVPHILRPKRRAAARGAA